MAAGIAVDAGEAVVRVAALDEALDHPFLERASKAPGRSGGSGGNSSLMQNSLTSVFSVIPAKAGIPFPRVRGKVGWGHWTPAFAGVTILFAST